MLGESVGWGFQMQYPGVVVVLATAVFVFGLSLFGVFEVPAFGTDNAHELSSQEGPAGFFFTGVFATLVATPCSAPFLGTATAFAFAASTPLLVLIFLCIGLGLASPFLLVAYVPSLYKLLPAPGAWMETLKHLLGFSLMATTLWLVWVYFGLTGVDGGFSLLIFLAVAALGAWIFGHFAGVAAEPKRQLVAFAAAVAVVTMGGWVFLDTAMAEPEGVCEDVVVGEDLTWGEGIPWQPFSDDAVAQVEGRVAFIDFTADWCVSCKVNEATVLETETVTEAMQRLDVVPLKADYTRKDPAIAAWLQRFNRPGVPMYLVLPAHGGEPILLPEVILPGMVVEALEAASR